MLKMVKLFGEGYEARIGFRLRVTLPIDETGRVAITVTER